MYETLSKAFCLPSIQTLTDYCTPGAHDPDGVLYSVLESTSRAYKEEILLKCQEDHQWLRCGILAFDSKKIKEKVVFDVHTGEIVGFSQDFFEKNIIFDEMKKFSHDNDTDKAPTT